ncbi:hypothetical protein M885DRAFT_613133 [Pelagophyceae sp. CCMP2097]|nr:hypothetical protein M885DRAFT_613133 [Pelagophyceae sp. CCMP2097]
MRVHLHFTKDFNNDFHQSAAASPKFRFPNKPRGVHHWLEHHGEAFSENHWHEDEDVVIVLLDPDFVLLRPMDLWALSGEEADSSTDRWDDRAAVIQMIGKPKAHWNGLGSKWLDFNLSKICGPDSPRLKVTPVYASKHLDAGPPYVAHWKDLWAISVKWVEFMPKFFDEYPNVNGPNKDPTRHYAEMYAYVAAVSHLKLEQSLINGMMVGCMVGWDPVDRLSAKTLKNDQCGRPLDGLGTSACGDRAKEAKRAAFVFCVTESAINGARQRRGEPCAD